MPSGISTRVKSITGFDGEIDEASCGSSITLTLENDIDVSRGDLFISPENPPQSATHFKADLVWLHKEPTRTGQDYVLKHTTRVVRARLHRIVNSVDVNTLERLPASLLQMNDIAEVIMETTQPLFFDPYSENRVTGSFILIDPLTNATVAAGMLQSSEQSFADGTPAVETCFPVADEADSPISRTPNLSAAIWITGNQSLAESLEKAISQHGCRAQLISTREYSPSELKGAARILRRAGTIAIFSTPNQDVELQQAITSTFDTAPVFITGPSSSDPELLTRLLRWLSGLREKTGREKLP